MKYVKIRHELKQYMHEELPVHRMSVKDDASGMLLNAKLLSSNFSDWNIGYVTPGNSSNDNVPGVHITTRSDGYFLSIIIFTIDRQLELISNDEFAAKRILVDRVFDGLHDFIHSSEHLTIFEGWTYDEPFTSTFRSALKS